MVENNENLNKKKPDKKTLIFVITEFLLIFLFVLFAMIILSAFLTGLTLFYENTWILVSTLVLLMMNTFYTLITTVLSFKRQASVELHIKPLDKIILKIKNHPIWHGIIALFNIIVAFFFFYFGIFFTLNWDGVIGMGIELQILVLIILYGLGALHLGTSVSWILRILKTHPKSKINLMKVKLSRGMLAMGMIFLFLISSIGISILISIAIPKWSPGLIDRQELFITGETYEAPQGEPPITGYRIPSLLWLPGDILLAFAEARENPWNDAGNIDIVMRRSLDGGVTWSPLQVIAEYGSQTAGNPCPVYDAKTGVVHMICNHNNEEVWAMTSNDKGLTWSEPRNITPGLELDGSFHGCGPGVGIQLLYGAYAGRLVIPSYGGGKGGSHMIYSDNHGKTWKCGESAGCGGECQVVESVDGSLYLNMRSSPNREVARSQDGGETWSTCYSDPTLPDVPCQAGVYRFTDKYSYQKNRILYCGPNYRVRGHYTIRISYDEGLTWPVEKELYAGSSAYGQLVVLSDNTIVLLFEVGELDYREGITFAKFDLDWLTDGKDQLVPN